MKKYFSYDAHCDDVHFFDTLEEAKQHHIGNCEELYDYFADSEGSAEHYVDGLESGFYGEVRGYSTCERRKPTQAECDEFDRDFEVYIEPPVLTEMGVFKVGNAVKVINQERIHRGLTGKVTELTKDEHHFILVEFDDIKKHGAGYFNPSDLELVK